MFIKMVVATCYMAGCKVLFDSDLLTTYTWYCYFNKEDKSLYFINFND